MKYLYSVLGECSDLSAFGGGGKPPLPGVAQACPP
jgi:hypothetical protein